MRIKHGARRVIKKFALFPIDAGGETAWFEMCYILQIYSIHWGWCNMRFITKEEYISKKEGKE